MKNISEGEKFDRFKEHIRRNKYRYLAGAVGVAAGRRFLHNYAQNPEGIKQNWKNVGKSAKDTVVNIGKSFLGGVKDTAQDIKTIATR